MGPKVIIYDGGDTYEVDSDDIYEPFPEPEPEPESNEDSQKEQSI